MIYLPLPLSVTLGTWKEGTATREDNVLQKVGVLSNAAADQTNQVHRRPGAWRDCHESEGTFGQGIGGNAEMGSEHEQE